MQPPSCSVRPSGKLCPREQKPLLRYAFSRVQPERKSERPNKPSSSILNFGGECQLPLLRNFRILLSGARRTLSKFYRFPSFLILAAVRSSPSGRTPRCRPPRRRLRDRAPSVRNRSPQVGRIVPLGKLQPGHRRVRIADLGGQLHQRVEIVVFLDFQIFVHGVTARQNRGWAPRPCDRRFPDAGRSAKCRSRKEWTARGNREPFSGKLTTPRNAPSGIGVVAHAEPHRPGSPANAAARIQK